MMRSRWVYLVAVASSLAVLTAAERPQTAQAPANKTVQAPVNKTTPAPVIKAEGKSKALNANARMGGHHKHYRHHRHHKHIGLHKTHAKHIAVKHVTPAAKRS